VHRDIKAENIMLRKDGIVQVMDFGLAKLRGVTRLTKEGSTIGTVGYMSPEQAQGQDVDHRTDIFSLGVVLFELLTGQLPFCGEHEAAIMYEIVNVDSPPPSVLKPEIDPELDRIILECLQKEPDERHQSAKEVAKDLRRYKRDTGRKRASRVSSLRSSTLVASPTSAGDSQPTIYPQAGSAPAGSSRVPWIVAALTSIAALASIVAIVFGYWQFGSAPPVPEVVRSSLLAPEGTEYVAHSGGHIALSPDGRHLVFLAADSNNADEELWVRPLNSLTALRLSGTEGATFPFWSHDGRQIAFFADNKLKKVLATGGPALTICDAPTGRDGSWNAANVILFSPLSSGPIHRVSSAGGESIAVTVLDSASRDHTHRWVRFLPDQEHFLFFIRTQGGAGGDEDCIAVASIEGGPIKRLVHTKSNVVYAAGHILYVRENTLLAHPFDPEALALTGDAFPIVEGISHNEGWSRGIFSVSRNGYMAYQTGEFESASQMVFLDRAGQRTDSIAEQLRYYEASYSPDERFLAVDILDEASNDIDVWILDLERDIRTRFTFEAGFDFAPIWSPDGSEIAFSSSRNQGSGIYIKPSDGNGEAYRVFESDVQADLADWSADGRYLVVVVENPATAHDIWIVPLYGDSTGRLFADSEFDETWPTISPDGRWLAYSSNESGTEEVYVTTFPDPGPKWQVSNDEGDRPHWRADGQELFYLDNRDRIVSAEVDGSGSSFKVGSVEVLFQTQPRRPGWIYDVTADGQTFIVNTSLVQGRVSPVTLVTNWSAELEAH
jgi:Tol biopolymer transport system component